MFATFDTVGGRTTRTCSSPVADVKQLLSTLTCPRLRSLTVSCTTSTQEQLRKGMGCGEVYQSQPPTMSTSTYGIAEGIPRASFRPNLFTMTSMIQAPIIVLTAMCRWSQCTTTSQAGNRNELLLYGATRFRWRSCSVVGHRESVRDRYHHGAHARVLHHEGKKLPWNSIH